MSTASLFPRLGLLRRLVRKELNEVLRDRRTILTLVLMPLLLYPLLGVALRTFLLSNLTQPGQTVYLVAVQPGDEGGSVREYLRLGQLLLQQRKTPSERDDGQTAPAPHEQPEPELRFEYLEDPEKEVMDGQVDVAIRVRPPGPFRLHPDHNLAVDWEVLYREDSANALEAMRYVEKVCAAANARFLSTRLFWLRIRQRDAPVLPRPIALHDPRPHRPALLPGLVPLILILMTITGAVYPAIDVTAGERERGTLEILAAAPVPRLSILFAKYVAVLTVAMLTALVNLGTMSVTLYLTGVGEVLFGKDVLSPLVFVEVLALLLLFAAFFSAVLLVLTSFARSFKEAQAYLVPLMLLALMPGILSLVPGVRLQGPLAVAPLINIALLTRDLLEGEANPVLAVVVVAATLLYALAALAVAARVFTAEAVLYSQPGGWADLVRRPHEQHATATPSAALLCVALLFPSAFVTHGLLARWEEGSIASLLLCLALANVLLFGGFPLVAAWWGRLWLSSAFRLGRPSWSACGASALLGLSLWPWVHEMARLLRNAGVTTLSAKQLEGVQAMLRQWETLPPAFVLLVVAVLPAVLEELFFRGYLFGALLSALRPGAAILVSALLFALFHLILAGTLVVERFVPSFLLGLVLGWTCWQTGSVWPGVLLHALHNGSLVLLGYYQPRLGELGGVAASEHLPLSWLAAAALGGMVGGLWMGRLRPSEPRP